MPSVVVIGGQWGDEGKGKIVDCLTISADWAVRFQGGNNAGHTLVVNGKKTKLQLVPCGILRPHARCLIGAGVVADPKVLLNEIEGLRSNGVQVTPERLVIDREAHLIMDYHPAIDIAREQRAGKNKIGTTGRGIGPVYEDRAGRRGVRFADLDNLGELRERLAPIVEEKNRYLKDILGSSIQVPFDSAWATVTRAAEELYPFVGNGSLLIHNALAAGKRVVFEGAQATLLDQTFGTVPYVTSCSTLAGAVSTGCGLGPKLIDYVLGTAKAYCTRVGEGPFPTELLDETGDRIRERGAEFGTVTGRPRRCGWLDIPALKRAQRLNGFDGLAITKLDVLSGLPRIKMCVEYRLDGRRLDDLPASASQLGRVEVRFEEFEGWKEDISRAGSLSGLPAAARTYLAAIEKQMGCPVVSVGVGPDRESIFFSDIAALNGFLGGR